MQPFPHQYQVRANAGPDDLVRLSSAGIEDLSSAAPVEFDGPGGHWSPETLLLGAVADCFVLSFRAVATASRFSWVELNCETLGTLDRVDRTTRFTRLTTKARLKIGQDASVERARALLEKAEQVCLISNSLNAERFLEVEVLVE
ncbi:MAG: OsmC family protein [Pseudomonadales bacterium]